MITATTIFLLLVFTHGAFAQQPEQRPRFNPLPGLNIKKTTPELYDPIVRIPGKGYEKKVDPERLIFLIWSARDSNSTFFLNNWKSLTKFIDEEGYTLLLVQVYSKGESVSETAKMFCLDRTQYEDNVLRYLFRHRAQAADIRCASLPGNRSNTESPRIPDDVVQYYMRNFSQIVVSNMHIRVVPSIWIKGKIYSQTNIQELYNSARGAEQ